MSLSDPAASFVVTGQALHGRFGLVAALTGSLEFEWLVVEGFDTNRDGKLTEAEAAAAMNATGLQLGMPTLPTKG